MTKSFSKPLAAESGAGYGGRIASAPQLALPPTLYREREREREREKVQTERDLPLGWRQTHLGRLLGHALRRFDDRVLDLMARDIEVPLALSNLAARRQVSAAHIHITRHLSQGGARLTELAEAAGMTKQAMGVLVDQCEAWGLVTREPDPRDARARRVVFTADGLAWLDAFRRSVAQAEAEFRASVGDDVATVVAIGLEAYGEGSG